MQPRPEKFETQTTKIDNTVGSVVADQVLADKVLSATLMTSQSQSTTLPRKLKRKRNVRNDSSEQHMSEQRQHSEKKNTNLDAELKGMTPKPVELADPKKKPFSFDKNKFKSALKKINSGNADVNSAATNIAHIQQRPCSVDSQASANTDDNIELIPPEAPKPLEFDLPEPSPKKHKKKKSWLIILLCSDLKVVENRCGIG